MARITLRVCEESDERPKIFALRLLAIRARTNRRRRGILQLDKDVELRQADFSIETFACRSASVIIRNNFHGHHDWTETRQL